MELDFECYLGFVFLQGHGQLDKYKAMLGYVDCYAFGIGLACVWKWLEEWKLVDAMFESKEAHET